MVFSITDLIICITLNITVRNHSYLFVPWLPITLAIVSLFELLKDVITKSDDLVFACSHDLQVSTF